MAIVKIVEPNNTPEQDKKVLEDIARVMEKIIFNQHGTRVKVELYRKN